MHKSVLSMMLLAASAPALPAQPATAVDLLVACVSIQDSGRRLACFDREIVPLAKGRPVAAATTGTTPPSAVARTPATPAPPPPAPAPVAPAQAETPAGKTQSDNELAIRAHISSQRPAGTGVFIIYLDNGQAWRHEDAALGAYLREGDAITISKASMGSYRLTRDGANAKNWIRVTPLR